MIDILVTGKGSQDKPSLTVCLSSQELDGGPTVHFLHVRSPENPELSAILVAPTTQPYSHPKNPESSVTAVGFNPTQAIITDCCAFFRPERCAIFRLVFDPICHARAVFLWSSVRRPREVEAVMLLSEEDHGEEEKCDDASGALATRR